MPSESRRDRFVRLANSRVNRALKQIELVGNLSVRSNYEFGSDDVDRIFRALSKAVREAKARFEETTNGTLDEFRLE
jgi:hypothetical protein